MICWDVTGITDDAMFHAQSSVLSRKFLRCAGRNKWNPCNRLAEKS